MPNENLENRKFAIQGKELIDVEKAQTISWYGEKVPIKIIMERTKRSKTSVFKTIAQAKNFPFEVIPSNKKHTGRPRLTTKDTDALIKREVIKNPD